MSKFFKNFQVQFVVFKKFTSAYYTKLQEKSCYYLLIIYIKRCLRNSRKTKFWEHPCIICNLHFCYNFEFVFHENALVFSQSEVHNFFWYIITLKTCTSLSSLIFLAHKEVCWLVIRINYLLVIHFYLICNLVIQKFSCQCVKNLTLWT